MSEISSASTFYEISSPQKPKKKLSDKAPPLKITSLKQIPENEQDELIKEDKKSRLR